MQKSFILAVLCSSCCGLEIDETAYKKIDEQVFKDGRSVTYTTHWQTKDISAVESVKVTYLKYEFIHSQSFNIFTADKKMGADFTISYAASGKLLRGIQVEAGNIWKVNYGHLQAANNPELSNVEYVLVGDGTTKHYFIMKNGLFVHAPGIEVNKVSASPNDGF